MTQSITSLHNPRIKELALMRRSGPARRGDWIIIDGQREISRAKTAGIALEEVFFCPDLLDGEGRAWVDSIGNDSTTSVIGLTPPVFAKIAYGERADGLIATAR